MILTKQRRSLLEKRSIRRKNSTRAIIPSLLPIRLWISLEFRSLAAIFSCHDSSPILRARGVVAFLFTCKFYACISLIPGCSRFQSAGRLLAVEMRATETLLHFCHEQALVFGGGNTPNSPPSLSLLMPRTMHGCRCRVNFATLSSISVANEPFPNECFKITNKAKRASSPRFTQPWKDGAENSVPIRWTGSRGILGD